MRILHITSEAPGAFSGGQIGVRQTLYSLCDNGYSIDYAGPMIGDEELKALYDKAYELEPVKSTAVRAFDSLLGHTNSRYRAWKALISGKSGSSFDLNDYDVFVMDFTRLDYVAEDIPIDKLIVRVHNVEADYLAREYEHNKSFKRWILKNSAEKRERTVIERAAKLVALSQNDAERLKELYSVAEDEITIVPVCIKGENPVIDRYINADPDMESKQWHIVNETEAQSLKMLITGSLWFGPNYEGIRWFLEKVYPVVSSPKELTIAGFKPNPELKALVERMNFEKSISRQEKIGCDHERADEKGDRISLIDSPEDMSPYFEDAELFIAPIFDGAGMKVKVAEALSYGLPVVGTQHAFIGYDIENGVNSWQSKDAEGFAAAIEKFKALDEQERSDMRLAAYRLFEEKYSQSVSSRLWKNEIEGLQGK